MTSQCKCKVNYLTRSFKEEIAMKNYNLLKKHLESELYFNIMLWWKVHIMPRAHIHYVP